MPAARAGVRAGAERLLTAPPAPGRYDFGLPRAVAGAAAGTPALDASQAITVARAGLAPDARPCFIAWRMRTRRACRPMPKAPGSRRRPRCSKQRLREAQAARLAAGRRRRAPRGRRRRATHPALRLQVELDEFSQVFASASASRARCRPACASWPKGARPRAGAARFVAREHGGRTPDAAGGMQALRGDVRRRRRSIGPTRPCGLERPAP